MIKLILSHQHSSLNRYQRNFILFRSIKLSTKTTEDPDSKLRSDIKSLGSILGSYIKKDDPLVFEAVEKLRKLGRLVNAFILIN
jgi:hypothetical protein